MRLFGLVMLLGFGTFGAILWWPARQDGSSGRALAGLALMAIGAAVLLLTLLAPSRARPLYRAWMRFGQSIGTVVSTLLLTALYFTVVTLVGRLMRLAGTDPLQRAKRAAGESYWEPHAPLTGPEGYEHLG